MAVQINLVLRLLPVFLMVIAASLFADRPPELPGDDISSAYVQKIIPQDSIALKAPPSATTDATSWLEEAMKTWNAPSLSEQIASDNINIPVGKGAIFVPRFSESGLEPDIEILDSVGNIAGRGNSGRNFAVLPGRYYVIHGSGPSKQRLVHTIDVIEGKPIPVIPDWAGLSINVVDENGIAIRGEYELTRIDTFIPFGRGYGPDPNLGEETKTWILKPGLYKIIGTGENYNTLKNFVTVQLLPGRFIKFLLVEDPAAFNKITGGGIVDMQASQNLAKFWKYGIDIGGNILFNAKIDYLQQENNTTTSTITVLLNSWFRYEQAPYDWNTNLKLDEGFTLSEINLRHPSETFIEPSIDEPRLTSLFIWRFLSWFGPYGRFEATSAIFPKRVFPDQTNNKPFFYLLNEDGTRALYDTISIPREREPSFSPMELTGSFGTNMDLIKARYIEARLRTGLAYEFLHARRQYKIVDTSAIDAAVRQNDSSQIAKSTILMSVPAITANAAGPEAAAVLDLRIGSWGTAKSEVRIFLPLVPVEDRGIPKLYILSILSWRISRAVTLDYQYSYSFSDLQSGKKKQSEHRLIIRYSYASR
ncbi:MAG: hypothetical protein A2293_17215 [Elusimicrobia bacterium RIFOXYB2_FULL_49_7]|nr:MAG: hypothetical protein A2293_17215 [Elusimicrobia bacterium RIFOXYB2_FULL_49_7]